MMFKKKQGILKNDALLCIPEKNDLVKEEPLDSGDLILSYPAMYKPFFSRIQQILRKNPEKTFQRKIQLDPLGVDVWSLLDGKRNVNTIIKKFAELHCLNTKEAELSVTLFLKSLGKKGLIVIVQPNK